MPNEQEVNAALKLITKGYAQYQYFFERNDDPSWIRPLAAKGRFKEPPSAKKEGEYLLIPPWPESSYLARMALKPEAQDNVLKTALEIPPADNARIHDDPSVLEAVLTVLRKKKWPIFRRVELNLLRTFQNEGREFIREFFRTPEVLAPTRHEAVVLLKESFRDLPNDIQNRILEWIDNGRPDDDLIRRLEFFGNEVNAKNIRELNDIWRRQWFSLLSGQLPSAYQSKCDALVAAMGPGRKLEEPDRIVGAAVAPQSPKTSEDFEKMAIPDILSFLASWKPSTAVLGSTAEGLGRTLVSAVEGRPRDFAAEASTRHAISPEDRLSEHLMIYYWLGSIDLDRNSLIAAFYRNAPVEVKAHAMWFIGNSVPGWGEDAPAGAYERLQRLIEYRLEAAQSDADGARKELPSFGFWFTSEKFPEKWTIETLYQVLKISQKVHPEMAVVNRLSELSRDYPFQCVSCLRLMIEGDNEHWLLLGVARDALQSIEMAEKSSNSKGAEAARELRQNLVGRGHYEFRPYPN